MVERAFMVRYRQRVVLLIEWRHIHHVSKQSARMMLESGRIFAQAKVFRQDALVPGAIDQITRADFFA